MLIGVRQQGEVAGALDRDCQLALVEGTRSGNAAGNDLARLGDVGLQGAEILVVDLAGILGGELAELPAA